MCLWHKGRILRSGELIMPSGPRGGWPCNYNDKIFNYWWSEILMNSTLNIDIQVNIRPMKIPKKINEVNNLHGYYLFKFNNENSLSYNKTQNCFTTTPNKQQSCMKLSPWKLNSEIHITTKPLTRILPTLPKYRISRSQVSQQHYFVSAIGFCWKAPRVIRFWPLSCLFS